MAHTKKLEDPRTKASPQRSRGRPLTTAQAAAVEEYKAEVAAERLEDHEARLRALEVFRWKLVGMAAASGAAGAALGHFLGGG